MAEHNLFSKNSKMKVYFPYILWQRGKNENTNGLIRQFFSKGTNFSKVRKIYKIKKWNKLLNKPSNSINLIRLLPKNLLFCTRILTPT